MPSGNTTFHIRVADRATGKETTIQIPASSREEAISRAQGEDWLVCGVDHVLDQAPRKPRFDAAQSDEAAVAMQDDIAHLRREIAKLRESPLIAQPKSTIAIGIILSYVVLFFMGLVLLLIAALLSAPLHSR